MSRPQDPEPVSLGFKVLVTAAALYLAWRLVQGVMWVGDRVL